MDSPKIAFQQPHVLLDIEGTTSSISFVKDVMFPYIRRNLEKFVDREWDNEEVQSCVSLLKKQCQEDQTNNVEGVTPIADGGCAKETVVKYVHWQMNQNRKTTALKMLEGLILKDAFSSGELKGQLQNHDEFRLILDPTVFFSSLYDDVEPALKSWKENEKTLHIYSSGSITAQRFFFGHSIYGDLLHLFSNHFDTTIGSKIEPGSYVKISQTIGCAPEDILFLTDAIKEAEAARTAGCRVIISERPGNETISEKYRMEYQFIRSFRQLSPES